MPNKFRKINNKYVTNVICPICKIERIISHKNYYRTKNFICQLCSNKKTGFNRRTNKIFIHSNGYQQFYCPEHPMAHKSGRVFVHRDIIYKKLGRVIKRNEYIHHIDGNKNNNNINNLKLLSPKEHNILHNCKSHLKNSPTHLKSKKISLC